MTLFMANLRMRRVEEIRVDDSSFNPKRRSNVYIGSRRWILMDTQVFKTRSEALAALREDMLAIYKAREFRQTKLLDAINNATEELNNEPQSSNTAEPAV